MAQVPALPERVPDGSEGKSLLQGSQTGAVMDTTLRPREVLEVDTRDLARVIHDLPVFTIVDAMSMCGARHRHVRTMLRNELNRRKAEALTLTPVTVTIPPFNDASPDQLRGGLLAAGWTVKTLAARIGRTAPGVWSVIYKRQVSAYVECAVMQAISGNLTDIETKEPQ